MQPIIVDKFQAERLFWDILTRLFLIKVHQDVLSITLTLKQLSSFEKYKMKDRWQKIMTSQLFVEARIFLWRHETIGQSLLCKVRRGARHNCSNQHREASISRENFLIPQNPRFCRSKPNSSCRCFGVPFGRLHATLLWWA